MSKDVAVRRGRGKRKDLDQPRANTVHLYIFLLVPLRSHFSLPLLFFERIARSCSRPISTCHRLLWTEGGAKSGRGAGELHGTSWPNDAAHLPVGDVVWSVALQKPQALQGIQPRSLLGMSTSPTCRGIVQTRACAWEFPAGLAQPPAKVETLVALRRSLASFGCGCAAGWDNLGLRRCGRVFPSSTLAEVLGLASRYVL